MTNDVTGDVTGTDEPARDWQDGEADVLAEELDELMDEIRGRVEQLLDDLDEAVERAGVIAPMLLTENLAAAAKTEEVAGRLANLRLRWEIDWRAVPDLPSS